MGNLTYRGINCFSGELHAISIDHALGLTLTRCAHVRARSIAMGISAFRGRTGQAAASSDTPARQSHPCSGQACMLRAAAEHDFDLS